MNLQVAYFTNRPLLDVDDLLHVECVHLVLTQAFEHLFYLADFFVCSCRRQSVIGSQGIDLYLCLLVSLSESVQVSSDVLLTFDGFLQVSLVCIQLGHLRSDKSLERLSLIGLLLLFFIHSGLDLFKFINHYVR